MRKAYVFGNELKNKDFIPVWVKQDAEEDAEKYWPIIILTGDEVKALNDLFSSILCLAGEGPEVTPHLTLFDSICNEARKGLKILEV